MTVPSTTTAPTVLPPAPHTRLPAEAPDAPQAVTPPARRRRGPRRGVRLALAVVPALLALPLVTAAHQSRQAPFGDRLTSRPAAAPAPPSGQDPVLRAVGPRVEAHDRRSGALRWVHERSGRRPLAVAAAPGHAFALWNDGLVTDTESATGRAVRWHRALPGLADWLAAAPGRGTGVLQLLDPEARMLAVVAPERITAYRTEDGDLRWVLPAARGCAFDPGRHVRTGGALLIAQPCAGNAAWTAELKAVDGLGRIVPGRTPLGNDLPGHRPPELPEAGQRKAVAQHG
ncbi:hypothetical protein [Streptomyces sp. GMY02]|uniref:hypothetical protein n=2 Tax=Streptomyces TaxID=1883 RepID=UPI0020B79637|nr:hypothetical protein [Streptomyces sp. GMY02]